jgi:hypothetical protein
VFRSSSSFFVLRSLYFVFVRLYNFVHFVWAAATDTTNTDGSGNVDESYANELLVAFEYSPTIASASHKVMLTSLTAQPDPDRPFVINGSYSAAPLLLHAKTLNVNNLPDD